LQIQGFPENMARWKKEATMPGIIGELLLVAVIGYLWGSIPSGYWMGKLLRGKDFDVRSYGSHKTGATNVRRVIGNGPALIVFLVDLSKGIGPALIATLVPLFFIGGWGPTVGGLAALLGHCFPIFIGFKGGRGVSTGAGTVLVLSPFTVLIAAITTFSTIATWRYVSLGSIVGAVTIMLCSVIFFLIGHTDPTFFARVSFAQMVFMLIGPGLIILFHSDNIRRLLAGTESKLGKKSPAPTSTPAPADESIR
jgi:acyl phosphate:glycerol-3-phosphate acyltransferase